MVLVVGVWTVLRALLFGSAAIALENLALRHQLRVLQRSGRRPRLARWDRVLWVGLCRVWAGWRSSLVIVQPATVLAWHRQGFQLYWRWKSRPNPVGRPRLDPELRDLIRRMARENPIGGRRRLRAELALLGYEVAELTVAKYMHRPSPRPSSTWRAFLTAQARDLVAIDFLSGSMVRYLPVPPRIRACGCRDRSQARAPVGGAFPLSPFRLRGGVRVPPWATSPEAPL